jgi:hypothetical protein
MTKRIPTPRSQPGSPGNGASHQQGTPRGRGAQPGNNNALKHGFYSRSWKPHYLAGLENTQPACLDDEITMLRVYIRRTFEAGGAASDLQTTSALLRALILACQALTRLLKTRCFLPRADQSELQQALAQALQAAAHKTGGHEQSSL